MPNRILNNKFEQKRTGINYIFRILPYPISRTTFANGSKRGHKECQDRWEKYVAEKAKKRKPRARHCYPYQIIRYSTICYLALLSQVALWWQVVGDGSLDHDNLRKHTKSRWRCAEKLFICVEAGCCAMYCQPFRSWQRKPRLLVFHLFVCSCLYVVYARFGGARVYIHTAQEKLVRIKYMHVHWLSGDRIIIWFENIKPKNVFAIFHSAANRLKSVMLVVGVTRSRKHEHTHTHLNPFISSHISTLLMASRVYLVYRPIGVLESQ